MAVLIKQFPRTISKDMPINSALQGGEKPMRNFKGL